MRVKINFAYQDEIEYQTVLVDHVRASTTLVRDLLVLKYRMFGHVLDPVVRGDCVYLKIPEVRGRLRPSRRLTNQVARECDHLCIRLSAADRACRGCGKDHDLQDLADAIVNPLGPDPIDLLLLRIRHLTPTVKVPTWAHRLMVGPAMTLN